MNRTVKFYLLVAVGLLAGCSAGTLSIDGGEPFRVQDCRMENSGTVFYVTPDGQEYTTRPNRAVFRNCPACLLGD